MDLLGLEMRRTQLTDSLSLSLLSLPLTLAHTPVLSPSYPSHHMSLYWDRNRASLKKFMCTVRPIIALMPVVSLTHYRCPSSRRLQEHSSVRKLSLILLESAQHCREPHHWLQPDLCSSPDWYPSLPVSQVAPNCHLSHCGCTQIWSHLQLLNLHHH